MLNRSVGTPHGPLGRQATWSERRSSSRLCRSRDEGGFVLAMAVGVSFVVILLSTTALEQSLNTLTQSAITGKQVSSTNAAEAGLQYEINQIAAQVRAGATTFSCAPATTLNPGAKIRASYSLMVASVMGDQTPAASTLSPCGTVSGGNAAPSSVTLAAGNTYLLSATGTTTASTIGSKTIRTQIYVPGILPGGKSGFFPEAIYGGNDLYGNGMLNLTGAGDTYAGYLGQCTSQSGTSSWNYGGNYYAAGNQNGGGVETALSGTCTIGGDAIINNTTGITLTGGSGVGGTVYTPGPVSIAGTAGVGGSVDAGGNINDCPTAPAGTTERVRGSITSGSLNGVPGNINFCPTAEVDGDINSNGNITGTLIDYGSFGTYANGSITLTNSYLNGVLFANGNISLNGGNVTQDIAADGSITLTNVTSPNVRAGYNSGTITLNGGTYGNVQSAGLVTVTGGAKVTGTIISTGGVAVVNGTVNNIEDENGNVSYRLNHATGPLQYCTTGCTATVSPYLPPAGPTSISSFTASTPPAGFGLGSGPANAPDAQNVTNNINAAVLAAVNKINNTPSGTTTTVKFPSLTYNANDWLGNPTFCGLAYSCTTTDMNLVTGYTVANGNCGTIAGYLQSIEVPGALPTVISTDCQFVLPTTVTLYNNLAIFAANGINLTGGFTSAGGKPRQLFLIVPSTSPTTFQNGAQTQCGYYQGPSISANQSLTDANNDIQDFLYTNAQVCVGATNIYGKVYAGEYISSLNTGSWNQTFADISPWVASGAPAIVQSPVPLAVTGNGS